MTYLMENAWISEVEIKKIIPDKIKITVKERKVSAIVKNGDKYLQSSKNGIILCLLNNEISVSEFPLITGLKSNQLEVNENIIGFEKRKDLLFV